MPRTNAQPAARAAMMAHGIRTHCVIEAGRLAFDSGVPAPDAIKTVNASAHAGRTNEARKRNGIATASGVK